MITSIKNENAPLTDYSTNEVEYTEGITEIKSVIESGTCGTSGSVQMVKSVSTAKTSGDVKLRVALREMAIRIPDQSSR